MALTLCRAARPGWSRGVWREKSSVFVEETEVPGGPDALEAHLSWEEAAPQLPLLIGTSPP